LFSNIGISSIFDEVKAEYNFQQALIDLSITEHDIYSWLDDNSERRNIIAHTFSGIDDILDETILLTRLDSLKALCEGISQVLIGRCLKKVLVKDEMKILKVHDVINCNILCCELSIPKIQLGDFLLSENGAGEYRCSEIVEIRVYDTSVNHVVKACPTEVLDIAVRCSHKIKKTNNFYIISSSLLSNEIKKE
ncbi:MAG: hypothetical protein L6Q33_04430, partial [Bacteriovoracaceae bacterium]|nr:hypothetical protein [Bacteriovoracaceae bacterium]